MNKSNTSKRLTASIISIVAMALCLAITTGAIVYSMVSVDSNLFTTGEVMINLNDGLPVVRQGERLMQPGETVQKSFFIKNLGSCEVYYKIYFQGVRGGLADVLQIWICDGNKVLAQGTPQSLTRDGTRAFDAVLGVGETKYLQIYFHFPKDAENSAQDRFLRFDLAAEAVQTQNNPNRDF